MVWVISALNNALDGKPWSFAGVIFGLERIRDDEGRPLSERRAPSSIKDGVPIELRSCPYADERLGQPMNVSALAQVMTHGNSVLTEISAFRAMGWQGTPGWDQVLATVIDQLASPACYLLQNRDRRGPVPARHAVGHKLAAGYFGVLRKLLMQEAMGEHHPVSVESLLAFAKKHRALIGASEACAGPPRMIALVSDALIRGTSDTPPRLPPERVSMARLLCLQVQVGITWELFDLESERRFLIDEIGRVHMRPRNSFLERKLDERIDELRGGLACAGADSRALPNARCDDLLERLRIVLRNPCEDGSYDRTRDAIIELLSYGNGALEVTLPSGHGVIGGSFARYLVAFREFVRAQWAIENELRTLLGFPVDVHVHLHPTVLPKPMALDWYEVVLGHRLLSGVPPSCEWTLRNNLRTASIA